VHVWIVVETNQIKVNCYDIIALTTT